MRTLSTVTYLYAGRVIIAVLAVTVVAAFLAPDLFDRVKPFNIDDPQSEVERAEARFESANGRTVEPEIVLLVTPGEGVDPRAGLGPIAERLESIPGVASIVTPRTDRDLLAGDGRSYLVLAYLEPGVTRVEPGEAAVEEFAADPDVLVGGTATAAYQVGVRSEHDTRRLELYAAPVLLLLLLLVFRTLTAAALPLVVAAIAILLTMACLRVLTGLTVIDLFSLQTVTGLGVGLAINYSLFVLTRYREEIRKGRSYREAHARTMGSAGRTVAFSSITVAAALASLLVFPQPFLSSTGVAGTLVAIFAGSVALLVPPACLALLGPSIDSFSVRRNPIGPRRDESRGFWRRLAMLVCARPVPALVGGLAVMILLTLPVTGIDFFTPDARELPAQDSAREVATRVSEDFPGIAPTRLAAVFPDESSAADAKARLSAVPGVEDLSQEGGGLGTTTIYVDGAMDPLSDPGQELVADVRAALPDDVLLAGRAAEQADQRTSIAAHAPAAIALVLGSSLLLMWLMTRSLVLPFLALGVNLMTVGAALGILAVVFDSDWLTGLLGTNTQEGIDISVPVIVFAITFGLSTDYGIFLLARIRELRAAGADDREAIVTGVATTGRLISASALLMAIAVGAFIASDLVIVKEFAIAIAAAVLIDATIVRGLIIPAALKLLGGAAWWRPRAG